MMYLQTSLVETAKAPCLSPFSEEKSSHYNSRLLAWRSVQTSSLRLLLDGEMLSDNDNKAKQGILKALIRRVYLILNEKQLN